AAALRPEGRSLLDALDDLARAHGLHVTDQIALRMDVAAMPPVVAGLLDSPPTTLGGSPVTRVVDLAAGLDDLPPTEGVLLDTADGSRVVVRPSGTEPKLKYYLGVVVPVPPGTGDLTPLRALARDRLTALAASMAAALTPPGLPAATT